MLHINQFVENVGVNMESKRPVGRPRKDIFPTKKEIEEIRRQDAERCKNYLTAEDFYRMYGDNKEKENV